MSFLSSVLSAVIPVAKIAAQVLPQLLGNAKSAKDGGEPTEAVPSVSNTLIDFVADERAHKVYAVNNTTSALAVTFQNNVETGGSIGVQSETFELPPRNSAEVTNDIEQNSDSGVCSANYLGGSATVSLGPGSRLAALSLPFVSAVAFTAFGGKVKFSRGTEDKDGKKSDFWAIESDNNLKSVDFSYTTQNGQTISFKSDLSNASLSAPVVYRVATDDVGLATGLLSNFSVSVEGDEAAFAALLSKRALVRVEDLPEHVRKRLRYA